MMKQVRRARHMTQRDLAQKSGVGIRMVQHYEQGTHDLDHAKLETLCQLAEALECRLYEILSDPALRERVRRLS